MNRIDLTKWKDFAIGKVFKIKSPAQRSIKEYDEGTIPYVSSASINNGVVSYLDPQKNEILEEGNCITVSPLDGSSFFQEADFLGRGGAGSAISLLYNVELSKYSGLFICTIIKIAAQKFDYADALTGKNLETLLIKLPVKQNEDGTLFVDGSKNYHDEGYCPDWEYMENYMKSVEEKAKKRIEILKSISF